MPRAKHLPCEREIGSLIKYCQSLGFGWQVINYTILHLDYMTEMTSRTWGTKSFSCQYSPAQLIQLRLWNIRVPLVSVPSRRLLGLSSPSCEFYLNLYTFHPIHLDLNLLFPIYTKPQNSVLQLCSVCLPRKFHIFPSEIGTVYKFPFRSSSVHPWCSKDNIYGDWVKNSLPH